MLGEAYYEVNDFTQAINYHETAIKLILSVCNGDDNPCAELLTAYNKLACIYCQQRSYSESLLYLQINYLHNVDIELLIREIFMRTTEDLRFLCIRIPTADDQLIDGKRWLVDYTIERIMDNIYFQWR